MNQTSALSQIDHWVFDLDNTLYPASCNLFSQIDWRMTSFISETLKLPPEEARKRVTATAAKVIEDRLPLWRKLAIA